MDILAAIKREKRKFERQLGKLQHQLSGVRAAAKALGHSAEREVIRVKQRTLSAASRAAIVDLGTIASPRVEHHRLQRETPYSVCRGIR
jgi:hypothetical protein